MKTIVELIREKREQVERLNAQLEVLEELAAEARGSGLRRGGRESGAARGRLPRGRAGRGTNQRKILKVLGSSPTRAKDIAAAARLSPGATNQVLMGLKKTGVVKQTGRGLYRLVGKAPTPPASKPRPRRRKAAARKTSRGSRKSGARAKTPAPSSSRQEAGSAGPGGA